jgi:uncharacterized membrane protein YraQ (UPF0718 family)
LIKNLAKKYSLLLVSQLIVVILFFAQPDISKQAWLNSFHFTLDVLGVLPPILLLMGLLDSWLPANAVESYLGEKSGVKGMLLAGLMGSVAAGPLFTAFPIAASFTNKGGRIANTVIFLGAWGTIKIPMLLMESRFLGLRFSLLRLAVTIPFIALMGLLVEVVLSRSKLKRERRKF